HRGDRDRSHRRNDLFQGRATERVLDDREQPYVKTTARRRRPSAEGASPLQIPNLSRGPGGGAPDGDIVMSVDRPWTGAASGAKVGRPHFFCRPRQPKGQGRV